MRFLCAILCMLLFAAGSARAEEPPLTFDRYGGLAPARFAPGPFFRLEKDDARWWLVTPEGGVFLSIGFCGVRSEGTPIGKTNQRPYLDNLIARHGSVERWIEVTRDRLQAWGVNTLAAWSSGELRHELPYTHVLRVASEPWISGTTPDLFSAEFEEGVRQRAAEAKRYAEDPMLIGYYLDNELPWGPDHRRTQELFAEFMKMPAGSPGKSAAIAFLREKHGDFGRFQAVWATSAADWEQLSRESRLEARNRARAQEDRDGFTLIAARQYFRVTTGAIREHDPNHLILGARFIWQTVPRPVVQACGEYCDVISVNFYETGVLGKPILAYMGRETTRMPRSDVAFRSYYALTGKPVMITEFGFRGADSGLPNTFPPPLLVQPLVKTQRDRAAKYRHYTAMWAAEPYMLGFHWFTYADQPKEGRFDGENGNYGAVTIVDEPYADFVKGYTQANREAWKLHLEARD